MIAKIKSGYDRRYRRAHGKSAELLPIGITESKVVVFQYYSETSKYEIQ
jgi:hypothetical protein